LVQQKQSSLHCERVSGSDVRPLKEIVMPRRQCWAIGLILLFASPLVSQDKQSSPPPAGTLQQREAMAAGSTAISKLLGKNFVYSVCGAAKDVLCIVDPNPNVDGYARSLTMANEINRTVAGGYAQAGFTRVSISDGKGRTWDLQVSEGGLSMAAQDQAAPVHRTTQHDLKEAVAAQPNDVNSIYLLAVSYLSQNPPVVDGLFWIARAAALSGNAQLMTYAKNQYTRYHGADIGFDELLAAGKAYTTIPAGFTVAPAPTPADIAAEMLKLNPPERLSFAEWQYILSNGRKDSSDQVWTAINGKLVQLQAVVLDATRDSLKLAGSADDVDGKKADITLTLTEPLASAQIPKSGTTLIIQGTPRDFAVSNDSFNMVFTDGVVLKGLQ
jgi:hypothetical protein